MERIKILFLTIFLLVPVFSVKATVPIRVLIVPGHDNEIWGAQYGNIKEADMNLVLGTDIYNLLKKDKKFEVFITRDQNGYTKTFADYFSKNKADIISFKNNAKKDTQIKIDNGTFLNKTGVVHNVVNAETAIELYGINKWANENKINAVINVHFNDYPRPTKWTIGVYKGFAIYLPDKQMVNASGSAKLAKSIFTQLSKKYISSTYKLEKGGLVSDEKLISLGASGTLNKEENSVLIEYGYIYEKIFRNSITRHRAYTTMAGLTATGIKNYFTSP
jgi:N-acetylmuramoyl-L-alanine amidase